MIKSKSDSCTTEHGTGLKASNFLKIYTEGQHLILHCKYQICSYLDRNKASQIHPEAYFMFFFVLHKGMVKAFRTEVSFFDYNMVQCLITRESVARNVQTIMMKALRIEIVWTYVESYCFYYSHFSAGLHLNVYTN